MPTRRTPLCSVVIRAFNEEGHIGRLLSGIQNQTLSEVEILLVDSGSTDATVAIASQYPVRVVSIPPESFTFGRSLNLGCRAARAERIVLASAHVYPVYPDWLARLLEAFRDPRVAMVYGKQRGHAGSRYSESQIFRTWFPETSRPRQDHPFCNNANAAIRKSLWKKRPYDENLPALEDIDWATWAIRQGHSLAYVAEAEVTHVHEESPRAVYNRYRREAMALRQIHPQTRFRLPDFLRLWVANVVNDWWHALNDRVLHRKVWEIMWFRCLQLWGTYRGFTLSGPLTEELKQTFYYPRGLARPKDGKERAARPLDYGALVGRASRTPRRSRAGRARSRSARGGR
ncbi:MAG: glycosyltransferase family 2 protein [Anaerolineales bacterium]